jgi:ribosome-associated protein
MVKAKRLRREPEVARDTEKLVDAVIEGILEKKGHSAVVMDLSPTGSTVADYFVVCHGDSPTQVDAIARSVEEEVFKQTGENPAYREGYTNSEWILLDYISVVVHIFLKEQREFYGIERFWADATVRQVN